MLLKGLSSILSGGYRTHTALGEFSPMLTKVNISSSEERSFLFATSLPFVNPFAILISRKLSKISNPIKPKEGI